MNCPNCQHQNPTNAKFCMECGTKLERCCANCQTIYPEGAKFCMECGFSLQSAVSSQQESESIINPNVPSKHEASPPLAGWNADNPQKTPTKKAAERRQLTCLFCDLVGSTALSEQLDAEDFRQVILDYQQIAERVINQHGGHVAQYLGDGLLVYFGYPKGLENAPKAGVQAGLGILDAITKANLQRKTTGKTDINIRIGINTGLVVVDDHLALGDTVNIAARLEGLAPVNGLVISPQTLKLVQGWFAVKSLGKEVLKGIKEPMEIFQVIKESGASSRIEIAIGRGLSPLVGREEEVYMLLRNWKKAKEGKGQLLLLNGEAGIGKSRLVESIKGQVKQETKAAKLELRCSDYHINSPFYPLIDLLEKRILRFEKTETAESKIAKLTQWFEFAGINKKPNLPIFADFLSIPISDDLRNQFENTLIVAAGKRKKFTDGFSTAVFNFALSQPLLLIVEDLHWMDSSTLEWLNQLVEQINGYPLFILGTTRPQFQATWGSKSYITQLNLARLNTDRIESICYHQTQGKPLPKVIIEQIKTKTDGVPLFVEELTRMIIESDLLIEKETHYELKPAYEKGFDLAVPSTLQDSLIARLDNLSGSRAIAQIGAVLGREFSFDLLQAVAQKEKAALEQDLAQLVAAELLYKRGVGTQATYIFKHALIQDTAYETLLRSKRQQLHQQVVTVLEQQFPGLVETQPELLAHHLMEAGLKEKALLMWEKAGQKAMKQNTSVAAVHHFQKAIALLPSIKAETKRLKKELDLLAVYNPVLIAIKGWGHPQVVQNSERIFKLSDQLKDDTRKIQGFIGYGGMYTMQGQIDKGLENADRAITFVKRVEEKGYQILLNLAKGELYFALGNLKESTKYIKKGIQEYDKTKHDHINHLGTGNMESFRGYYMSLNLMLSGYPAQAKNETDKTFQLAIQQKDITSNYRGYLTLAWNFMLRKEWKKAAAIIQQFIPIVEESGETMILVYCQFFYHSILAFEGSKENREIIISLVQPLDAINLILYHPYVYSNLAAAALKSGDYLEGLQYIEKAFALDDRTEERVWQSRLFQLQGDLLVQTNQPTKAEQSYHQAITIAQEQSAKWFELLAAKSLARLWQSQGKTAEAYEVLHGVYSWFTEGFDTKDMVEAKALLVELKTI